MIQEDNDYGVYTLTNDTTFSRVFLSKLKELKHYAKMCPVNHQPARLHGTAEKHKFEHPQDIIRDSIKFWPAIDPTGTRT